MEKQQTLILFEKERARNNVVPPLASNSFYDIGDGQVILKCLRNLPDDFQFDLTIHKGRVYTGIGCFYVVGQFTNKEHPYRNLTVQKNTALYVNQELTISGKMDVYGDLVIMPMARCYSRGQGEIICHPNSTVTIDRDADLLSEISASIRIFGTINIHISKLSFILHQRNITFDSAAKINVIGFDKSTTDLNLVQYMNELNQIQITKKTQREHIFDRGRGRLLYIWKSGDPKDHSHIVDIKLLLGEIPLGYFKFSCIGELEHIDPGMHCCRDLHVEENTKLIISEKFRESTFMYPELYIGVSIDNCKRAGKCYCNGTIICDGDHSKITIDRNGTLIIGESGEVYIQNGAVLQSTNNSGVSLIVNGLLIIDDLEQIETLQPYNIQFGPRGKIIIRNPDRGEKRILFRTPVGIQSSALYRILRTHIEHLEFHISRNTGILIDRYFEWYARDMVDWFGGRRIEKAIKDGILVWESGGFIALNREIIPWVNRHNTLLHAARLFKTFGSTDEEKLQDCVHRLIYAGCKDIHFRFIYGDAFHEQVMYLDPIHLKNVYRNQLHNSYVVETDNDGMLFMKNRADTLQAESILRHAKKEIPIVDHKTEVILP